MPKSKLNETATSKLPIGPIVPVLSTPSRLGIVLKEFRRERDLTLSEMAAITGVAASTLSRIENNQVSLTLDKMLRLSRGLGVELTDLIASPSKPDGRQMANGRRAFDLPGVGKLVDTPQYEYHYHSADLTPKRMVPMTGLAKCRSLAEFGDLISHDGEEWTYVLEGAIEVHTEFYSPLRLEAGGSVYFDSTMKHAYLAVGPAPARLLCVCAGLEGGCVGTRLEPHAQGAPMMTPATNATNPAITRIASNRQKKSRPR
jgi:transcriptional regulator with XRE-family HTH domain